MDENLKKLYSVSGNEVCADCNAKDPGAVVFPYKILVCRNCAGIHRSITDSRVRDLIHDKISSDIIEDVMQGGNKISNEKYLKYLPMSYRLPDENGPEILRKVYIKAKYVKKEFHDLKADRSYLKNVKIGVLKKRCKDKNRYNTRYFRMSINEISFNYFIKENDAKTYDKSIKLEPKRNLRLDRINATFITNPDTKRNFPNPDELLMISFFRQEEGSWRHIYLTGAEPEDLVDWYQAIRFAKFSLRAAYVVGTGEEANEVELARNLTLDITMSGWLQKTGPSLTEPWQKRWCVLLGRRLLYSTESLSPCGKGEIVIGEQERGYYAEIAMPSSAKRALPPDHSPLAIYTPGRVYLFIVDSQQVAEQWRDVIMKLASTEMSVREMADYQLHPKSNMKR